MYSYSLDVDTIPAAVMWYKSEQILLHGVFKKQL